MKDYAGLQQKMVNLDGGTRINYYWGGPAAARPVVLLHGGGTDHALLSWRDTIPPLLSAGYRVYAPDYPGYGSSPPDLKIPTTENQVGYLEALMQIWALGQAALVGISMGGALALGYTLKNPGQVERLVLVGSYGLQDKAPYHRLSYLLVKMPWLINGIWCLTRRSRLAAKYGINAIIRNPQSRTPALLEEVMGAMRNTASQRAFSQWQQDEIQWGGLKTNYTGRLSEIDVPVLLVHGTHDSLVPLKYARQAAPFFRNGRLEVFANAGHWTQRDYPERFNRLLLEFLET